MNFGLLRSFRRKVGAAGKSGKSAMRAGASR
jgi:hypothetical protein